MPCKSSCLLACSLFIVVTFPSLAVAQNHPASDSRAVTLASQSLKALTLGSVISDIKLTANVTWVAGPEPEAATGILLAKGTSESRTVFALNGGGNRIEIRSCLNGPAGKWINPDGKSGKYAAHNSLTDAVWFFPALSSLANVADPRFVFSYVGEETWNELSTIHLRSYQAQEGSKEAQKLSTMDFYLDPASLFVLGISYKTHPDNNSNVDLLSEVRFADYKLVNGIPVPFYIQRLQSGAVLLDIKVTNVYFNSGESDSLFEIH